MSHLHRVLLATAATLALAAAASAEPVKYNVDGSHSEVGFDVRHFFGKVHGRFTSFQGSIVFDEANPAAIVVDATAEAKSISTDNERRDGHLRSADFFAVDSFPTLSFKSTRVTAAGTKPGLRFRMSRNAVTASSTLPSSMRRRATS